MAQTEPQIDPGELEAFAARGYSLIDIARLLGVDRNTLLNHRNENQELADAHNRGHLRWKDAGSPEPVSVKVLIENQVYALLQQREMSRPQLKDELGFRHEEINLAIESLEENLLIQREDDVRTSWYRASGVSSPCAEKRKADASRTVSAPTGNNGNNETAQEPENSVTTNDLVVNKPENNADYICVDCGGPRSYGSGQRCQKCFDAKVAARKAEKAIDAPVKVSARSPDPPRRFEVFDSQKEGVGVSAVPSKFGISVNGEIRKIVEGLPIGAETDTPSLLGTLLVSHPNLKTHPELNTTLKTYISQAVSPLKGKLLELVHKGRGGQPDTLRRIAKPEPSGSRIAKQEDTPTAHIDTTKERQVQAKDTSMVAHRTTATEVYGGVRLHEEIQVRVEEMANWPAERIAEFFEALGKVIEIPQRPMPKTVKRAWSKDFENDNSEDGTVGLTYLYLISMLHDGMEEHEKQAVWTLVLYLKRMQAAAEERKSP